MPHAPLEAIDVHYDDHGEGDPLVLLHGGMLTTELSFGDLLPLLAVHRRVIAVELQGHGRTPDVERAPSLAAYADDVVGVLDHLDIARADLFGASLGGLAALETAVRHPDRVDHLVLASVHTRRDGYHEDLRDPSRSVGSPRMPTEEDFAAMVAEYDRYAAPGTTFESVNARVQPIVTAEHIWAPEQLAGVTAPTLVVVGDLDFVRIDHAEALRDAIPRAHLAVVPDATHQRLTHRVDVVAPLVEDFLRR